VITLMDRADQFSSPNDRRGCLPQHLDFPQVAPAGQDLNMRDQDVDQLAIKQFDFGCSQLSSGMYQYIRIIARALASESYNIQVLPTLAMASKN
jgi:hypothetical protein